MVRELPAGRGQRQRDRLGQRRAWRRAPAERDEAPDPRRRQPDQQHARGWTRCSATSAEAVQHVIDSSVARLVRALSRLVRTRSHNSARTAVSLKKLRLRAYCLCDTSSVHHCCAQKWGANDDRQGQRREASATENGSRHHDDRARLPAEAAPTVHAVPVEHAEKARQAGRHLKSLPVRPGEDPWTKAELDEVKTTLTEDIARFESQIEISTAELVGLLRDGSEGAGRDPADVGSANFERDAEMSLANNAREMLDQSRLALRHIELGTYGSCDNCGQPIGKGRLQAFPRATLCVTCKQREERR